MSRVGTHVGFLVLGLALWTAHVIISSVPVQSATFRRANGESYYCNCHHDLTDPRYVNMDFLFFKTLQFIMVSLLVVSYDIACQWSKNLRHRMSAYPSSLHIVNALLTLLFLVPKFHLPAHIKACQTLFSFHLNPGVGQTDGEAPERGWADINRVASSTKEMGPGKRRDTLDDHFGDWNWKKTVSMGELSVT